MPETVQPPSLGRVVHYVLPDSSPRRGEHRSATVTGVWGDVVNLSVHYDQHDDVNPAEYDVPGHDYLGRAWSVSRDDTAGTYGTWHFPEFVEAKATRSTPPAYVHPTPEQAAVAFDATTPIPALTAEQIAALESPPITTGLGVVTTTLPSDDGTVQNATA